MNSDIDPGGGEEIDVRKHPRFRKYATADLLNAVQTVWRLAPEFLMITSLRNAMLYHACANNEKDAERQSWYLILLL